VFDLVGDSNPVKDVSRRTQMLAREAALTYLGKELANLFVCQGQLSRKWPMIEEGERLVDRLQRLGGMTAQPCNMSNPNLQAGVSFEVVDLFQQSQCSSVIALRFFQVALLKIVLPTTCECTNEWLVVKIIGIIQAGMS